MMDSLSEYEKLRARNLQERLKILDDLDLKKTAEDLVLTVKYPKFQRVHQKRTFGPKEKLQPRRSVRLLQRENASFSADPETNNDAQNGAESQSYNKESFDGRSEENEENDTDYTFRQLNDLPVEHTSLNVSYATAYSRNYSDEADGAVQMFRDGFYSTETSYFEKWGTTDQELGKNIATLEMFSRVKVGLGAHNRSSSFCFHPSTSKVLVASGSKRGDIWIGDLTEIRDGKCASFNFKAHKNATLVSCVSVHKEDPSSIYSCAYDGSVTKLNLDKFVFHEVLKWEDDKDNMCKYFDFVSRQLMLLVRQEAPFALIDLRSGRNEMSERGHVEKRLHCVNVHPHDKNYFVTSSSTGDVKLWDLRKTTDSLRTLNHSRSVRSAFFSPLTGHHILTVCSDDSLNVWDVYRKNDLYSNCTFDVRLASSSHHDNQTGRWLTPFLAKWHPRSENLFICGSMDKKRQVGVFNRSCRCVKRLSDLNSVCSLTGFHPTFNMAVGLNSSTYLYIWLPGGERFT